MIFCRLKTINSVGIVIGYCNAIYIIIKCTRIFSLDGTELLMYHIRHKVNIHFLKIHFYLFYFERIS